MNSSFKLLWCNSIFLCLRSVVVPPPQTSGAFFFTPATFVDPFGRIISLFLSSAPLLLSYTPLLIGFLPHLSFFADSLYLEKFLQISSALQFSHILPLTPSITRQRGTNTHACTHKHTKKHDLHKHERPWIKWVLVMVCIGHVVPTLSLGVLAEPPCGHCKGLTCGSKKL